MKHLPPITHASQCAADNMKEVVCGVCGNATINLSGWPLRILALRWATSSRSDMHSISVKTAARQ